jgi:hypothetical protein
MKFIFYNVHCSKYILTLVRLTYVYNKPTLYSEVKMFTLLILRMYTFATLLGSKYLVQY